MSQTDRTLQDTRTSLAPAEVIGAAKRFFARRNSVYTAFVDMEGPEFVSLRGAGGEEIIIGVSSKDGSTLVTGSTYYFDQQLARFFASLPGIDGALGRGASERAASVGRGRTVSAPFVTTLRSRPGVITIGDTSGADVLHIRVEVPEAWDVVRIDAPASETVRAVKVNALNALCPDSLFHDDFSVKLRGWEILNESHSLAEAGVLDGSILLVTHRRRRAVR